MLNWKPNRLELALASAGLSSLLVSNPAFADLTQSTQLERVTVVQTGSIMSRTESEVVRPIAIIEGEEMEKRRAGTIGEALDGVPGISNADFGPGVGRPVIRGLQGSRVAVLEDGSRTSDVSGEGQDHAVASSTLRADSVEVIRGPAMLLYGSGATGGVVNVVSGRFSPIIGDRVNGTAQASYGTNGNDRRAGVAIEVPFNQQMALRADVDLRKTDNFAINGYQTADGEGKNGTLLNSDVENQNVSMTGVYAGDRGFLGLGFSQWVNDYGIPEADYPAEYDRIEAKSQRVDLRAELYDPLPGFNTARLNLAYTNYAQDEWEYENGNKAAQPEAIFKQKEFDLRVELTHNPIGDWGGVVGLDYNQVKFEAEDDGEAFFIRPSEKQSLGLFSMQEKPTSWGQFEIGFRLGYDQYNPEKQTSSTVTGDQVTFAGNPILFETDPGTQSYLTTGIALGAVFDIDTHHQIRTGISRSEAAPGPEQLYAFGRHGASGTFEIGNPNLKKEVYLNTEIGLMRKQGALRYEATLFANLVDNFVYFAFDENNGEPRRVNGNGIDDPNGELMVYNQQADALFYGVEASAAIDLETRLPLTLRASGDYLRGELRDGGNLPRMTPPRIGLGADTRWQDMQFSLDTRYHFKQTQTAQAETATDGYATLGFDLVYTPSQQKDLRLFLQGRNLTDSNGRLHQSFFKNEAPITGRNFTAGVRYQF